jgi:hypothetical protein
MFAQGEKNNKFVNNIQSQAPCIIWQKKKTQKNSRKIV